MLENVKMKTTWPDFLKTGRAPRVLSEQLLTYLRVEPDMAGRLTQLVMENQNLESVFKFLTHCHGLVACFLKGNRLITRDLPFMRKVPSLVKLDISANSIHFLPEADVFSQMVNL